MSAPDLRLRGRPHWIETGAMVVGWLLVVGPVLYAGGCLACQNYTLCGCGVKIACGCGRSWQHRCDIRQLAESARVPHG